MPHPPRILVVAAHPDDDVIGCGGTLSLFSRAGSPVFVVYITDGSRSHPGSRRFPPRRLASLREREARRALQVLGIAQPPAFLRLRDGALDSLGSGERDGAIARLVAIADRFVPDFVLAPWRRDPHPDHVAASSIARAAVASMPFAPEFVEYEVWLPIRGSEADRPLPEEAIVEEVALDARAIVEKRMAILAHATQATDLIDDDPRGFRIDDALLRRWLRPIETFYVAPSRDRPMFG